MGVDAQGRPDDDGGRFADQRAASLRRMFPNRPAAVPVLPRSSPPPALPPAPVAVPPRRRRSWVSTAVAGGVVALVAAGVVAALRVTDGFFEVPAAGASVGASLPVALPPSGAAPGPAKLTVTGYSACSTGGSVAFKATFRGSARFRQVFIDADRDITTGYDIPEAGGFGADYLIENDRLYRSTDPRGWSWTPVKGADPLVSVADDSYRWVVPARYGGVRVVFTEADGVEAASRYTPVVKVATC